MNITNYIDRPRLMELMIDAGADVEARNNNGDTALMIASYHGYVEVVELLRKASK